ncbi:conserved hypothetical protein, partial [Ricinus communis]
MRRRTVRPPHLQRRAHGLIQRHRRARREFRRAMLQFDQTLERPRLAAAHQIFARYRTQQIAEQR